MFAIRNLFAVTLACVSALSAPGIARAAMVYVAGSTGSVVRYNTTSGAASLVGTLSGFPVVRVMGLAYDPLTNGLLILDRDGYRVYTMNSQTGAASLLFNMGRPIQGGAVSGGLLYGVDEVYQTVYAYSLTDGTNQNLSAPVLPEHTHALGVDPSGQMYSLGGFGVMRTVASDGSFGAQFLTESRGTFYYDIDYLDGDFVATREGAGIDLINGTSGVRTTLLDAAGMSALGISSAAGIVAVVPEPGTLGLWSVLGGIAAWRRWTRRSRSASDRPGWKRGT